MKSDFIRIDPDLGLYCEEAGQGERVILLLPGWTMSNRVFERQLEFFDNSAEYRFITFDPRAHGQSSKTADGHYYEQHGRDLQAFIDKLGLDRIVLGGWSFGCLATLSCINQFGSDRLCGFIMLDGPPRTAGHDNRREWVTYRYDDADGGAEFYTLERLRDPAANNRAFAAWMLENRTEENIRWVLENHRKNSGQRRGAAQRQLALSRLRGRFARTRGPAAAVVPAARRPAGNRRKLGTPECSVSRSAGLWRAPDVLGTRRNLQCRAGRIRAAVLCWPLATSFQHRAGAASTAGSYDRSRRSRSQARGQSGGMLIRDPS